MATPTVRCYKCGKRFKGFGWYCRSCQGKKNPHRRTAPRRGGGGGGGTNWGMIALVGGGAYLLLSSGMLGRAFGGTLSGQTVTPQQLIAAGYQDTGGGYYRNPQTGQTIYRNPQTGRVQPTGGAVPAGTSPWLAPLYQIGQAAIPAIGTGVATGIATLFKPSTWTGLFGGTTQTPGVNEALGGTMPESGSIFGGGEYAALPPIGAGDFGGGALPPLEPSMDLWSGGLDTSWLDSYQLPDTGVSMYSPDLPQYGWMTSLELAPVAPIYPDTSGWFSDYGAWDWGGGDEYGAYF